MYIQKLYTACIYTVELFHYYFRHILAILHFNENLHREKRKAKDGTSYFNVVYPKYKSAEELLREIAVPPTYSVYMYIFICTVHVILFSLRPDYYLTRQIRTSGRQKVFNSGST